MKSRPLGSPALEARWTPTLATLFLLIVGVLVAYRDTGLAMVAIWSRSDTFAHAFLVPPIVAWLIWRKRDELAVCVPHPTAWMLLPIGVASIAWLLGDLSAANALAQLAFTALLVFVIVAVIGVTASRVIAFPLAFVFFSVPLGEFLMPQMMQWTADFAVVALRLSGIPVYREGLQFVVPSGNWSVVEACSGIRYLIASIMVGTLFAYLNYRSLRRRLIFVGISILVPIVANWIRAYLIVLMGDLSGNAAAVSADHLIYGWAFFGIVITLMFMIGARWSEASDVPASGDRKAVAVAAAERRLPVRGLAVAVVAALLFLLPHQALRGMQAAVRSGTPNLVMPPMRADWRSAADAIEVAWHPAYQGTAAESNRWYANGRDRVGLYVGYYRNQDYVRKLVSSENQVVTLHDKEWSPVGEGEQTVSIDGAPRVFRKSVLRAAAHIGKQTADRLQVWRIYWIDGTWTSNDAWAKARIAVQKLLGRGDDAAVIMVYRRGHEGDADDASLASFLQANLGTLGQALARTRDLAPPALSGTAPGRAAQ